MAQRGLACELGFDHPMETSVGTRPGFQPPAPPTLGPNSWMLEEE